MSEDERTIKTADFERWLAVLMAHTPDRRSSRGQAEHADALDRLLNELRTASPPEVIVHEASDSQVIARITPG